MTDPLSPEDLRDARDALTRAVRGARVAESDFATPVWLQQLEPAIRRFATEMRVADVSVERTIAVLLRCLEDSGFKDLEPDAYEGAVDRALRWAIEAFEIADSPSPRPTE